MVGNSLCGSSPWKRSQRSFASRAWRGWNEGWRRTNGTEKRWWRRMPGGEEVEEEEGGRGRERREAGWRLGGWSKGVGEGMSPELERWQSIDLVGFTVSFYLSLSFYISTRDSTIYSRTKRAHQLIVSVPPFLSWQRARSIFAKWIILLGYKDKDARLTTLLLLYFKPRSRVPFCGIVFSSLAELLIIL